MKLPAGGTAQVRLAAPGGPFRQQVQLELSQPPKGIAVKEVSPDPEGLAVVLSAEEGGAAPGLKGNLIANAFAETATKSKDGKPAVTRRTALGMLPAIPFEVVAAPPAGTAKPVPPANQ